MDAKVKVFLRMAFKRIPSSTDLNTQGKAEHVKRPVLQSHKGTRLDVVTLVMVAPRTLVIAYATTAWAGIGAEGTVSKLIRRSATESFASCY